MALKNVGASVRARLLRMAQERHDSFEGLLVRYVHERFLYRLSRSVHGSRFTLKGALLFAVWGSEIPRATRDLDLLCRGDASPDALAGVFRDVCQIAEDDGVAFDAKSVDAEPIREHQTYVGVRVVLRAAVDQARVRVQVDVGFGDAVDPPAERAVFPALLDAPAPIVMVYPREVVIAEKFQAMVDLGVDNSRMKDYFDIEVLARRHAFGGSNLARALDATFRRRGTALPRGVPPGLSGEFANDTAKRAQWTAFTKKLRLGANESISLEEAVTRIGRFLLPVTEALLTGKTWSRDWPAGGPWVERDRRR
jgi:hypothetical protein